MGVFRPRHIHPLLSGRALGCQVKAGVLLSILRATEDLDPVLELLLVVIAALAGAVEEDHQRILSLRLQSLGLEQLIRERFAAGLLKHPGGESL